MISSRSSRMTLDDILQDIYTLEDEMRAYERKYGVLSETFYDSYVRGEEPPDKAWVRDWTAWAPAHIKSGYAAVSSTGLPYDHCVLVR
jgi:hypothetical protein